MTSDQSAFSLFYKRDEFLLFIRRMIDYFK